MLAILRCHKIRETFQSTMQLCTESHQKQQHPFIVLFQHGDDGIPEMALWL